MLTLRLWQTISAPAYKHPIFKRIRNEPRLPNTVKLSISWRTVYYASLMFFVLAIIRTPHFLMWLFQIPIIMVMLVVTIPIQLPILIMLVGGYLVVKITTHIHKEKRQYTYDLLCASPEGALYANWIFAIGILHRGDWFEWIESIGQVVYRIGQVSLLLLTSLTAIFIVSSDTTTHMESIRTLVNITLLFTLYYTSMRHSIVLSLIVGLHTTSLDFNQRDSSIIGLVSYIILQLIPYSIALSLFAVLQIIVSNPHPIIKIMFDIIVFSSIYAIQELNIILLWHQLSKRLNETSDSTMISRQIAPT